MSTNAIRTRSRTRAVLASLLASLVVVVTVFAAFPRGADAASVPKYRVKFDKFEINNDMDGGPLGCGEFTYQRMFVAMPVMPETGVDKDLCDGHAYSSFMGAQQTSGWFPLSSNDVKVGYYFQEDDVIQVDEGGGNTMVRIQDGATNVPFKITVWEYNAQVQYGWDADPRVGLISGHIEVSY